MANTGIQNTQNQPPPPKPAAAKAKAAPAKKRKAFDANSKEPENEVMRLKKLHFVPKSYLVY